MIDKAQIQRVLDKIQAAETALSDPAVLGNPKVYREKVREHAALRKLESVANGVRSRTLYLGAPSSRVRVRLYEKGRFEQQQGHEADSDWFRLEAQIRPTGKDARQLAAHIDPAEAWGMARWTRELAATTMGLNVEPITMQLRREPDYMRAIRNLSRQYGATLAKAIEVEGSWEAVGDLLRANGAKF